MANVTLYVADEEYYIELYTEIKYLWYSRYKESLTKSAAVIKSLEFFREHMTASIEGAPTQPTLPKLYSRFPGER